MLMTASSCAGFVGLTDQAGEGIGFHHAGFRMHMVENGFIFLLRELEVADFLENSDGPMSMPIDMSCYASVRRTDIVQ